MMRFAVRLVTLACLGVASSSVNSAASLDIYLSAPGQQSTFVTGALTETFDSASTGQKTSSYQSVLGTYQLSKESPIAVLSATQYGGAHKSQFMSMGAPNSSAGPVALELDKTANYFGFWWSAGDANNGVSFYNKDVLLARFNTESLMKSLYSQKRPLTALNGNAYHAGEYYGNPNTGENKHEPYAYLNVVAQGTRFDKIIFDNFNRTGTGFESDNHSVYAGSIKVPDTSVLVESIPTSAEPVPEPSSMLLIFGGSAAMLGRAWWSRRSHS